MIIVKFEGRLGNQLFQYAFAHSISKKLRTFFLIDRNSSNAAFFTYFKYPTWSQGLFRTYLIKKLKKILPKKNQKGTDDPQQFMAHLKNNHYYEGFFQSELYFRSDIKKSLVIKDNYTALFNEKFAQFFDENRIIAIHCRLGDYFEWGSEQLGGVNLTLPQAYYENCLNQLEDIESYKVLIVTDDKINIKSKFDFISDKIILSQDEIMDFQILQNADIVITSNSSFSWWAAYLNEKAKIVFAPEYWLGFKVQREYPNSIIPKGWIKINCYNE